MWGFPLLAWEYMPSRGWSSIFQPLPLLWEVCWFLRHYPETLILVHLSIAGRSLPFWSPFQFDWFGWYFSYLNTGTFLHHNREENLLFLVPKRWSLLVRVMNQGNPSTQSGTDLSLRTGLRAAFPSSCHLQSFATICNQSCLAWWKITFLAVLPPFLRISRG